MILAQFEDLKFEISSSSAMLFQEMKLEAESETKDETADKQQYVKAKNGKPLQVTMTAILSAALGADVENRSMYMLNAAQRSQTGYLYIGGKKIFPFKLMLVKAETEAVVFSPAGKWISTNVGLTLKQCSKEWISKPSGGSGSSGGSGGGGGGGKDSTGTTGPRQQKEPMSSRERAARKEAELLGIPYIPPEEKDKSGRSSSTAKAVSAAEKTVKEAKKTKSTVTKPQPLTAAQKARADAKTGALLGI